ncbi:hypothetical protein VNI00_015734 [Paramarasmius palmivorus]|uniref:Uncharacterized protein n=1 Tax=Paramarasmius palmivorus TaxID=297713 RepID=A0AAW0BJH0_9AGAR
MSSPCPLALRVPLPKYTKTRHEDFSQTLENIESIAWLQGRESQRYATILAVYVPASPKLAEDASSTLYTATAAFVAVTRRTEEVFSKSLIAWIPQFLDSNSHFLRCRYAKHDLYSTLQSSNFPSHFSYTYPIRPLRWMAKDIPYPSLLPHVARLSIFSTLPPPLRIPHVSNYAIQACRAVPSSFPMGYITDRMDIGYERPKEVEDF